MLPGMLPGMLIAAVEAAVAGEAAVVAAGAGSSVADVIGALRAAGAADAVLLLLQPDVAAIDRAMLLAALGPLATAMAPRRLVAIDLPEDVAQGRVVATARYLVAAHSTTGQCLQLR